MRVITQETRLLGASADRHVHQRGNEEEAGYGTAH